MNNCECNECELCELRGEVNVQDKIITDLRAENERLKKELDAYKARLKECFPPAADSEYVAMREKIKEKDRVIEVLAEECANRSRYMCAREERIQWAEAKATDNPQT